MGPELLAAIAGALIGGALTAGASYMQHRWSRKKDEEDRKKAAQMDVVRELMRHRGGGDIYSALNEVPLVFGHDKEALTLYRSLFSLLRQSASNLGVVDQANSTMADLLNHLGKLVGLPGDVRNSDMINVFAPGNKWLNYSRKGFAARVSEQFVAIILLKGT